MRRTLYLIVGMMAGLTGLAQDVWAQRLELAIANGRVTLLASNIPVDEILSEWGRVGHTTIIGGEKLARSPHALWLVNVPEGEALDIVLRSAAGYVAVARPAGIPGASKFDRILILASSHASAATAGVTVGPGCSSERWSTISAAQ